MLFADPYIEQYTAGAAFWKALIYGAIAAFFIPLQRAMERWVDGVAPLQPSRTQRKYPHPNSNGIGGVLVALMMMYLIHGCGSNQGDASLTPSFRTGITGTASDSAEGFSPLAMTDDYEAPFTRRMLRSFTDTMNAAKAAYDAQYATCLGSAESNPADYSAAYDLLKPWSRMTDSVSHYTKAMKVGIAKAEGDHKLNQFLEQLRIKEEQTIAASVLLAALLTWLHDVAEKKLKPLLMRMKRRMVEKRVESL